MLILTPTPLQTAAERAFFAELAGWDSGSGVRGAVMAALPIVEGPMQRRQCDAVLFVPEGVAVVRVVEVERQSGVVTATPEGAWTIGPGDGPGDVLQLAGGGSSPLDGLMRAGMHAAVTLRKSGLEPGRIARLTVLTGAVTGLLPADGDLGEGDQVAVLDARSLLLGVARAARHAGTDNPRLWTTADVRAGIEALGVAGRVPSVEELNGEGFPYSPYVLRRQELLTPAAMNAAPSRAGGPSTSAAPTAGPAVAAPPPRYAPAGPLVDPAAAARVAAAAVQAQEEAERGQVEEPQPAAPAQPAASPQPVPTSQPGPTSQPVPTSQPAATPTHERFAEPTVSVQATTGPRPGADQLPSAAPPPGQPGPALPTARPGDTLALIAEPPAAGTTRSAPGSSAADTGGLGGLFGDGRADGGGGLGTAHGDGTERVVAPPAPRRELPPELQPRRSAAPPPPPRGSSSVQEPDGRSGRGRVIALAAAALAVVLVLVVVGVLALRDGDGDDDPGDAGAATTPPATSSAPAGPVLGSTEVVNGVTFTLQATQADDTCQGHAYGAVAGFFDQADCAGLTRSLWSADAGGQPAVVSLARVEMPDVASAQALRSLADTDSSGNVSDLLREGVTWAGGPTALRGAQYASAQQDALVTIVETSWTGASAGTAALDGLASTALSLPADAVTD